MARKLRESVKRNGLLGEVPVAIVEPAQFPERARDAVAVEDQDAVTGGLGEPRVQRMEHGVSGPGNAGGDVTPGAVGSRDDVVLDHSRA